MTTSGRTRFHPGNPRCPTATAAALLFGLLAATPSSAAPPLLSALSTMYPTAPGSRAVAIGDLNGDGKQDVVTVTADGVLGPVSVLLGAGDGSLQPHTDYPAGPDIGGVRLADLNSDGRADVLAFSGSFLYILLANGDGSLQAASAVPNQGWQVGDVDGDGKLDLVAIRDTTVSIRLGVGDGTFGPATGSPVGTGNNLVGVGDLNGDGRPDLLVRAYAYHPHTSTDSTFLRALIGNGDGSFTLGASQVIWAASTVYQHDSASRTIVGDVNADGMLDVVCGHRICDDHDGCSGYYYDLLMGQGDGTFSKAGVGGGNPLLTADVDGNGVADVISSTDVVFGELGGLSVALHQHDGSSVERGVPAYTQLVAIGDLNGDGRLDLATVNIGPYVSVLIGNGDGSFGSGSEHSLTFSPAVVATGDVNGDGRSDVVALPERVDLQADGYGAPGTVLLDQASSGFVESGHFDVGGTPLALALGNLNGDAAMDLVVSDASVSGVWVSMANGFGGFAPKVLVPNQPWTYDMAIGDLNRDGHGDLVLLRDFMAVLLGNGDGTFGPPTVYPNTYSAVRIADLDRDGIADLVLANPTARAVSVMPGDGTGGFRPKVDSAIGTAEYGLALGDLNGDGKLDLVATSSARLSALLGDGHGGFVLTSQTSGGGNATIGDLNSDGAADVVMPLGGSQVEVLLGANDGTLAAPILFGVGGVKPLWAGIADRNGDGRADLTIVSGGFMVEYDNSEYQRYAGGASVSVLFQNTSSPTPVAISLAGTEVHADRVRITWMAEGAVNLRAVVQRSDVGSGQWADLGGPVASGNDQLTFEDRTVQPGATYGYRLAIWEGAAPTILGPEWVTVPVLAVLSLTGASPNPSERGVAVRFSLPSDERATLELFDLRGRRVAGREVGRLGAGNHFVPITEGQSLPAGVYLVRLTQGRRTLTAKACVVK